MRRLAGGVTDINIIRVGDGRRSCSGRRCAITATIASAADGGGTILGSSSTKADKTD